MGLCTNEVKRKRPLKTIIIPKGIINPSENNVIEIPLNLDTTTSLIVKAPADENACFSVEPYRGTIPTLPQPSEPATTFNSSEIEKELHEASFYDPGPFVNDSTLRPDYRMLHQQHCQGLCTTQTQYPPPSYQQQSTQCNLGPPIIDCHTPPSPSLLQPPDAHSPLCPICARASCKYFSGASRTFHQPPSFPFDQTTPGISYGCHTGPSYPSYRLPTLQVTKSDIFAQLNSRVEDEMLNKVIDEKIDRILKPVLYALTKSALTDDDEIEISDRYVAPNCQQARYSCSSIGSKCSRDRFPSRLYESDDHRIKHSSFENTGRRTSLLGYEGFKRDMRRKEVSYMDSDSFGKSGRTFTSKFESTGIAGGNVNVIKPFSSGIDYDSISNRSSCSERDNTSECPTNASCQKRTSVSFREKDNSDSKENDSNRSNISAEERSKNPNTSRRNIYFD